jgi:transcriptional regulator with XRE-family HTH domain
MALDVAVSRDPAMFGRLVRQHRTRIGLTQRELADLSTVSVRAIRDLEQGRALRPRPSTVALIAEGLRLGPRARTALLAAAGRDRGLGRVKEEYDAAPPAPPAAIGAVLGRDHEIGVVVNALASGAERLVNIIGLGGTGKTRLALEVAHRLHVASAQPVLWCELGESGAGREPVGYERELARLAHGGVQELFGLRGRPVRAPQQRYGLVGTAMGAVGAFGAMGAVAADEPGIEQLAELVGYRPAVLVVDGTGSCAPQPEPLERLLRACPELSLLTTARLPYRLPGERPVLLGPLATPELEPADVTMALTTPSVQLFLEHARRNGFGHRPSEAEARVVLDICVLLDGLPLAVASVASWLAVYDLATLRAGLRSGPRGLLSHASGIDGDPRLGAALRGAVQSLPPDCVALLADLCEQRDGAVTLDELAEQLTRPLPDCARLMRELLWRGLVRSAAGGTGFEVLNLVRAHHLAVGTGPARRD